MRTTFLKILLILAVITVFFSIPLKAQWSELNTGVNYDFKALSVPTADIIWASGHNGKVVKSIDGGLTWADVSLPVPGGDLHGSWNLFAVDANLALVSTIEYGPYVAHLFKTTDGGTTWNEVLTQAGTMFNNVWIYPDNTAFLVGDQLGDQFWIAYISHDAGSTWTPVTIPCSENEYGYNNSLFVRKGITYFAGTTWDFNTWTVLKAQVYKSADLIHWVVSDATDGVQPPDIPAPNCLWLNDINKGYINGSYTVNGGKKWHMLPSPDPASQILTLVGYEQKLWAITNSTANLNVYYTNNRGNKWTVVYSPSIESAVNNQLTGSRIMEDNITLYLIRSNGTIAKYVEQIEDNDFAQNISNISVNKYSLSANYPNPFNPATVIQYQIPQNGLVSIKVYDMLGKEITTLVNEIKDAGKYNVKWDASGLSSGIYFYQMQCGNFSETRKMMLLK